MSRRKHIAPEHRHEQSSDGFSFQLSLKGIIGIGVVVFCLFLWMFLLGIWAGQTLLAPPPQRPPVAVPADKVTRAEASSPVESIKPLPEPEPLQGSEGILILPGERKKRVAQPEPPAATRGQ
jgi:hypothetical protein